MEHEKQYRYWLCNLPGIGARKIKELIQYFGSAEEIWKCDELLLMRALNELSQITAAQSQERKSIFQPKDLEILLLEKESFSKAVQAYHSLAEQSIRFIIPEEKEYPLRLKAIYDMPQGLYAKGQCPSDRRPAVAIVGARSCSHYGKEMAFYMGKELCRRGVDVISGMALGIDGAAHRGALESYRELKKIDSNFNVRFNIHSNACVNSNAEVNSLTDTCIKENNKLHDSSGVYVNSDTERYSLPDSPVSLDIGSYDFPGTYAVLGCGVDICYPRSHTDIYEQVQGIVSEFPPGTPPLASNFPMRNRIISGLADMVIVIEARFRSGSLITADQALEQGKDVYAIPGRITDSLSRGCNELIRQGAGIITDPKEFLEEHFPISGKNSDGFKKNKIGLALTEEKVYSCLDFNPTHFSMIAIKTELSEREVLAALMQLMMKNLVIEVSKNYYALKFR